MTPHLNLHKQRNFDTIAFYGVKEENTVEAKTFDIEKEEIKQSYFKFLTPNITVEIWMHVPKGCKEPSAAHVVAIRVDAYIFDSERNPIKQTFLGEALTFTVGKFNFTKCFTLNSVEFNVILAKISALMSEPHKSIFLRKVYLFTNPKEAYDKWVRRHQTSKKLAVRELVSCLLAYTPSLMVNTIIGKIYKEKYTKENKQVTSFERKTILMRDFNRAACDKHIDYAISVLFPKNPNLMTSIKESDSEISDSINNQFDASPSVRLLLMNQ